MEPSPRTAFLLFNKGRPSWSFTAEAIWQEGVCDHKHEAGVTSTWWDLVLRRVGSRDM